MKYLIGFFLVVALASIIIGFTVDISFSEKLIGGGVLGLFLIVFPLFSWYRWKDRDVKEYMLTKENLDKMRDSQKDSKD